MALLIFAVTLVAFVSALLLPLRFQETLHSVGDFASAALLAR
jgi:hypothetical protein